MPRMPEACVLHLHVGAHLDLADVGEAYGAAVRMPPHPKRHARLAHVASGIAVVGVEKLELTAGGWRRCDWLVELKLTDGVSRPVMESFPPDACKVELHVAVGHGPMIGRRDTAVPPLVQGTQGFIAGLPPPYSVVAVHRV